MHTGPNRIHIQQKLGNSHLFFGQRLFVKLQVWPCKQFTFHKSLSPCLFIPYISCHISNTHIPYDSHYLSVCWCLSLVSHQTKCVTGIPTMEFKRNDTRQLCEIIVCCVQRPEEVSLDSAPIQQKRSDKPGSEIEYVLVEDDEQELEIWSHLSVPHKGGGFTTACTMEVI